jgi:hypothetical protein
MVVIAIAVAGMSAQDANRCRTKAGDMSMLFTLNGLQDLGAGNYNGGVGLGFYLIDGIQLRFGLGYGSSSETVGEGATEAKESSSSLSFVPAVRLNLLKSSTVVGYTGLQLGYTMNSTSTEAGGTETGSTSGSTIGVGALLGAEWFPWENVSLGLEYGLGFSTSSSTSKDQSGTETDGPSTTAINLGFPSSSVNFTLALYIN